MPDKGILDFLKKSMMLKVQYEWYSILLVLLMMMKNYVASSKNH